MTKYGSILLLPLACLASCTPTFPVRCGETLTYSRAESPIPPDSPGYGDTLQVRWLGTAVHFIQLGPHAVMTDPYFSHFRPSRVFFGKIQPDVDRVGTMTQNLPAPDAIFIGHAHYDHILDLPEVIRQRGWRDVPIYGGPSMRNILAGYGEGLEASCRVPAECAEWTPIADGLAYRAFAAKHACHLPGVLLFPGRVTNPLKKPPASAWDFRVGETYTYLFRLQHANTEFTVFFAGAATDGTVGIPDDLPRGVDVAILCVPGWRNVDDYPVEVIRRLRPRVVVLTHLNNFLQDGWKKREVVATADLPAFLDRARAACDHPEFERIVITDVGGTVRVLPRAQ